MPVSATAAAARLKPTSSSPMAGPLRRSSAGSALQASAVEVGILADAHPERQIGAAQEAGDRGRHLGGARDLDDGRGLALEVVAEQAAQPLLGLLGALRHQGRRRRAEARGDGRPARRRIVGAQRLAGS